MTSLTVNKGTATATYDVSGITVYASGIDFGGKFYAGSGDAVSLTLSHADAAAGYNFSQYATTIEAGKPYLVKVGADKEVGAFDLATVSGTTTPTVIDGVVSFIPVLQKTQVTADVDDILFLGADNPLLNPSAEGQSIKGFRAYFLVLSASSARSFVLNFGDGEASGIRSLTPQPLSRGRWEHLHAGWPPRQQRRQEGCVHRERT